MKEAVAANRRQPPPPRFYNFNPTSGIIATTSSNDSSSNNHSYTSNNMVSKSYSDDLSVLSPNLKSYLQTTTTAHNTRNGDNNNKKEEEVYSPHLDALSSPTPFTYTNYSNTTLSDICSHIDYIERSSLASLARDGLLHSIFSAKKQRKKKRSTTRRRASSNSNSNNEQQENDNDVLGLFSPGTQEFDIDEALLANNDNSKDKDNYDDDVVVDDMMTLDSVDRIVRGDYLKRNNHRNPPCVTNEALPAKTISFTSPTTTNTTANVSKQHTAVATTASTSTTTAAAMTTPVIVNTTVKTPNYSTPHNNNNNNDQDEEHEFFYFTPQQQQQQDKNDNNWGVMSLSTTSRVSSLAPVWEEAEEEEEEEGKEYVHYEDKYDDGTPPFHTPNEYHDYSVERRSGGSGGGGSRVKWNMMMVEQRQQDDVIAEEEEEEEEFFSPLGHSHYHHHHVVANDVDMTPKHPQHHTPNYHHQQQQQRQVLLENESYKDDTIMEEWKNTHNNLTKVVSALAISNEMNSSNHQQQQQQQQEQQQKQQQNVTSPRLLASSPKYLEMREELQQMLVEAKGLTPRKESAAAAAAAAVSTAAMESSSSPLNERTVSSDITDGEERDDNVQSTMTTAEATRSNNNNNNKSNVLFSPSSSPSATAQHSFNYSPPTNTTTTPNSYHHHHHHHRHHLHSSSVSSLPPDALTVDFVRQCDDLDTLKAILSLLSDDDDQDDVRNNNYYGGKNVRAGKKLLRYPSLVRYVEKRMKIVVVAASATAATEDEDDEMEQQQQYQVVDHAHSSGNEIVRNDGIDKENVNPGGQHHHHELSYANQDNNGANDAFLQGRRSVLLPPPLETISLSQSPGGESNDILEGNEWSIHHHHHHRQITPENQSIEERSESMMTHETTLDMNLSESLDDESYFWRQDGGQQEHEKVQTLYSPAKAVENEQVSLDAGREHHVDNDVDVNNDVAITPSAPQEEDCTPTTQRERYAELQEKLASSLAAHAELTERVESLVKEHDIIKDELTSKLNQAREQLSQRQNHASAEKEEYTKQVSQLVKVNQTLEQEMSSLKGRLEAVDQKAVDAASQAEFQLDQSRLIHSKLSKDNERLGKELDEARQVRDKAAAEVMQLKQMLNEQIATSADSSNNIATKRMQKGLDAAKFANHALANALAISEKDLSEALHQKEKSVRECNALRERIVELEDKSSWLSSKVNEMTRELKSSHAYIDELYAGLQSNNNRSPSKEMKAELERRELQWLELEHQYTRRIQELESQIARQSGSAKVSMADYVVAVRECRKHQSEAAQKQQVVDELESTISGLKQQIETMQRRPSPRNGVSSSMTTRGKSISTMKNYGKKVRNESIMINDENKVPSPEELRAGTMSGETGGKKTRRISALKAVGGRKGLSEHLRRARRVGGEE
jgi:hypothetical protein